MHVCHCKGFEPSLLASESGVLSKRILNVLFAMLFGDNCPAQESGKFCFASPRPQSGTKRGVLRDLERVKRSKTTCTTDSQDVQDGPNNDGVDDPTPSKAKGKVLQYNVHH